MKGFGDYGEREPARTVYDMPAAAYHTDADGPRLSQSLGTLCLNKSPLHAWQAHPQLGARGYEYEPSEDDGTLIHALVLEPDSSQILELDTSQIRTKSGELAKLPMGTAEGKLLRSNALAAGQIPVLSDKLGVFRYKAKAVRSRLYDQGVTFDGASEVVIYWTACGVRCRCRLDHLIVNAVANEDVTSVQIIDLKSAESAHENELKANSWKYGYDVQEAAYTEACEAVFPNAVGRIDFVFAFCELEKPYAVNPLRFDAEYKALGRARWNRGRERWRQCLADDKWRGYGEGIGTLGPPPWAQAQEMRES